MTALDGERLPHRICQRPEGRFTVAVPDAGTLLGQMEAEGLLAPGRPNRAGRGFFYGAADAVARGG